MAYFRKKPVEVEAVQWTGDNYYEIADLAHTAVINTPGQMVGDHAVEIHTPEGMMRAEVSDWIIKGVQGVVHSCKPDIFQQTHEPLEKD